MLRVGLMLLATISLCGGCALRQRTATVLCDDCLPPPVAGTYKYHRKIDNFLTTLTAQQCAHRDLKEVKQECGPVGTDYKDGYTQAYIDLAAGRPACVPAVPPPKYWHAWHRSCAGREAVDDWYAGYRNGLDHGVNGGVNRFNRIVSSPDGCCVSAAYVSPYATEALPNAVVPLNGQVISQSDEASSPSGDMTGTDEQPPIEAEAASAASVNLTSGIPAEDLVPQ